MATKTEQLKTILERLGNVGGIKASAVISVDGLPIVPHTMPQDVDANTFAAMLASMVGAAETALKSLGSKSIIDSVVAESRDVRVVAVKAGEDAILTIMMDPSANYGLIRLEAKRASDEIEKIMKQ
jgi:hypothetical protein